MDEGHTIRESRQEPASTYGAMEIKNYFCPDESLNHTFSPQKKGVSFRHRRYLGGNDRQIPFEDRDRAAIGVLVLDGCFAAGRVFDVQSRQSNGDGSQVVV
jgi:hypothetical protein